MGSKVIRTINKFKNLILEGVPGTGKTHSFKKILKGWKAETGRDPHPNIFSITFHPSFSYEDFVEGLRPLISSSVSTSIPNINVTIKGCATLQKVAKIETNNGLYFFEHSPAVTSTSSSTSAGAGSFEIKDGIFLQACTLAACSPDKDVFILVDEINRANTSKVLGDLLTLLERSKRAKWNVSSSSWELDEVMSLILPYSGRRLFVPENLYVVATQNTSDKSIAPLDIALRRRFAFERVDPMDELSLINSLNDHQISTTSLQSSISVWTQLNNAVLMPLLGPDALIGHSYFYEESVFPPPKSLDVEIIQLHKELIQGITTDTNQVFQRVIWVQTGVGTGGSSNQLDLCSGGKANKNVGIIQLFEGPDADKDKTKTYSIDISYLSQLYKDNPINLPSSNQTWRLLLKGVDGSGNKLTTLAPNFFGGKILTFAQIDRNTYRLRVHEADVLADLVAWSGQNHDEIKGASSRQFGQINNCGSEKDIWLHQILPQLAEILNVYDAVEIIDQNYRQAWIEDRIEDSDLQNAALTGLSELDTLLGRLEISAKVHGSGLGRAIHIKNIT
ncbi:MAG: AAA domain-containing protein [Methylotenera sp.]|nr:AAA domain-containing protein [Methylotenera sp.]